MFSILRSATTSSLKVQTDLPLLSMACIVTVLSVVDCNDSELWFKEPDLFSVSEPTTYNQLNFQN